MTKLVSMKMSKTERDERNSPTSMAEEGPIYPYGLSLSLDGDALDKVGMSALPEVGEEMLLHAKVKVTSVSSNEHEHGKHKSVSLQITDLGLEDAGEKTAAADALYKG